MGETIDNSKIILDVDKINFKICWGSKDHILRRVGVTNDKISVADWYDFFITMERNYGDDTPEMWREFTYADEKYSMRAYITPKENNFQLTLRDLPEDVFGQKYKTFKRSTMIECYKAGYDYVISMIGDNTNDAIFWKKRCGVLEEENKKLKEDKKDLLQILDDISEEESEKAATERKSSSLEYMYDYETVSWRRVTGFDEFGQAVLAPKGFPFDDVTGIKIINLYHRKGFTPKQIVSHLSLYSLNKHPEKTVRNFLRAYNGGLLDRAIIFCCNNPFNEVDMDSNKLLNKV